MLLFLQLFYRALEKSGGRHIVTNNIKIVNGKGNRDAYIPIPPETKVTGFELSYNDALTPPKYEIILLTTGRGDPFYRSLNQIEVLGNER